MVRRVARRFGEALEVATHPSIFAKWLSRKGVFFDTRALSAYLLLLSKEPFSATLNEVYYYSFLMTFGQTSHKLHARRNIFVLLL